MNAQPLVSRSNAPEACLVSADPRVASPFPQDAHAMIYRPARSAMTSGKARTREWKLRFDRRTAPIIEPLMGWTSCDDPLPPVELSFPSAEAAIGYARRQGLAYTILGLQREARRAPLAFRPARGTQQAVTNCNAAISRGASCTGPHNVDQRFAPAADPAASDMDPQHVLRDPALSTGEKRDPLHRWALDAYRVELARAKAKPQVASPHLPEVIDAMIDLDVLSDDRHPFFGARRKAA